MSLLHAGGATVHTGTGEHRGHPLSEHQIDTARRIANERDWVLELYSADGYAVESTTALAVDHAALIGVPFETTELGMFVRANHPIVRAQFVVPEADIPAVRTALDGSKLSIASATSPIMPGAAFVSATKEGVTKASGISQICGDLDLSIDDVMMIGDGLNDLPAIEAVGHPVAMGNAAPEVKALARYHVASVDEDGVAEALDLSETL